MRLPQAGEIWTPKDHDLNVPVHGHDPKGRDTVIVKVGQPIRIVELISTHAYDPELILHMRIEVKGITVEVSMSISYIEPLL